MDANSLEILQRVRQFAANNHSLPQRPLQMIPEQPAPSSSAEEFYKEKYIKGMKERLDLHQQIVAKDLAIQEKEHALSQVLEYIAKLEQELGVSPQKSRVPTSVPFQPMSSHDLAHVPEYNRSPRASYQGHGKPCKN